MKKVLSLLFAAILLECALATPVPGTNHGAEERDESPESVDTQNKSEFDGAGNFKGVISTNVGYPFLQTVPHTDFFNIRFFDNFERLFSQFNPWRQIPFESSDDKNDSFDPFGIGNLPEVSKNGTTSTVKVVDGHKIEVNESTYGDQNSVFKVRVVNIRPVNPTEDNAPPSKSDTDLTTSSPKDEKPTKDSREREPLEKDTSENEVADIDGIKNI